MLLFCFSRLTRTFLGQRALRGGANGVVYMKCGGRTDWRGGGAATSATDATGLLERLLAAEGGAEPARRIITSLTSPGLVVGMNNIQSSLSPLSPSRKEVRGENTRNCFIRWNINQPSAQEQNTNIEYILKIHVNWDSIVQLYMLIMKKNQKLKPLPLILKNYKMLFLF